MESSGAQPDSHGGANADPAQIVFDVRGSGDPILLLHGFPHTRALWRDVTPTLVEAGFLVVAPDLRGTGESGRASTGYDALTLARDLLGVLDRLGLPSSHVVGFDVGAAPAFALAAAHPDRVASLTIAEAIIGGLPGAEAMLTSGGPWWFAFHQVAGGFAEDVVQGNAERYIRFFLETGSRRGVPADLAEEFVRAYRSHDDLRSGFEHYRAMPANAEWVAAWADSGRLRMPVTAIGAATVGDLLARQLDSVSDDLESVLLQGSGHIVPIDAPTEFAQAIRDTVDRAGRARASK